MIYLIRYGSEMDKKRKMTNLSFFMFLKIPSFGTKERAHLYFDVNWFKFSQQNMSPENLLKIILTYIISTLTQRRREKFASYISQNLVFSLQQLYPPPKSISI